jgi:hypothetical protein
MNPDQIALDTKNKQDNAKLGENIVVRRFSRYMRLPEVQNF